MMCCGKFFSGGGLRYIFCSNLDVDCTYACITSRVYTVISASDAARIITNLCVYLCSLRAFLAMVAAPSSLYLCDVNRLLNLIPASAFFNSSSNLDANTWNLESISH